MEWIYTIFISAAVFLIVRLIEGGDDPSWSVAITTVTAIITYFISADRLLKKCPHCGGHCIPFKEELLDEHFVEELRDKDRHGNRCQPYHVHGTERIFLVSARCKKCKKIKKYKVSRTSWND